MKALLVKEIRSFLSSVIGYIFIGIFLVLNGLFLWFFSFETNLLDAGYADLRPFFEISPIIFIILIPAITMKSFSEERRTGTIELLFTKPITDTGIILGKYFAGVLLVIISILPTLIYYISLHFLGDPVGILDDGATVGSYIGLCLMGASFVSIGIFASSITKSQIVAFILSMFLCWFLFLGFDLLASFGEFGGMDYYLKQLGMLSHFESIQKGLVDSRDIIYFLSLIVIFVYLTYYVLQSRKW